ncbi:MAG: MFS transporter [Planctomycetaceae bacterium]|nr:MFS transporter [Planctomycetaceae bacterium]
MGSHILNRNVRLLFATRCVRLFAYGSLSVILALYLAQLGFSDVQIGLLLTLTLVGDTAVSLWLTTHADRLGRRRILVVGAILMALAGIAFALSGNFFLLLVAATIGVISPSGNEVGPFLSVEQAALSQITPAERRTGVFAWYNLAGSLATALGSLSGGAAVGLLQSHFGSPLAAYRVVIVEYAILGLGLLLFFTRLSSAVEVSSDCDCPAAPSLQSRFGLNRSSRIVLKLSSLFALDAFAGGFVIQSIAAYWFHLRFGVNPATLGGIFFGANLLAGLSSLVAAPLAARFGLVNTMVFTHLPSNVLLILVPLMPSAPLAIAVLLLRFSISQMDVPTRQSYTMAVVRPDERSAAAGVTGVARTTGAAVSPLLAGLLLGTPSLLSAPFFLAGGLKIVYDLLLYRNFTAVKPPDATDERAAPDVGRVK